MARLLQMRHDFSLASVMFADYAWRSVKDESPDGWPVGYDLLRDAQPAVDPRQYLCDHYVALAASWRQTERSRRTHIGVLPTNLQHLISRHFITISAETRNLLALLKTPSASQNYIDCVELKYMGLPSSIDNMPYHVRFFQHRLCFVSWPTHHLHSQIKYAKTERDGVEEWCYVYAQPQPHTPDWQPGKFYYAETRPAGSIREYYFGTIPDNIAAAHMQMVFAESYKFLAYMQKLVE